MLYPLKFKPIFHYRIWGGNQLKSVLGKAYEQEKIGESWEVSTVKDNLSLVANGELKNKTLQELIQLYPKELLGEKVYAQFGYEFPLLIKFIDAAKPLSVQVHPDDALAKQRHNSFGKTEMWFVLDCAKDAKNIIGFTKGTNKKDYFHAIEKQEFNTILQEVPIQPKDVFFVPAGRVHAIGENVLLAEIQQTSNVTYRIYDYDRIDKDGKTRELHTDLAADAIDFDFVHQPKTKYKQDQNTKNRIVDCPFFTTDYLPLSEDFRLTKNRDSFKILICVEGKARITCNGFSCTIQKGETILLPASLDDSYIETQAAEFLLVYLQ